MPKPMLQELKIWLIVSLSQEETKSRQKSAIYKTILLTIEKLLKK